jgi:diamine N-acetyltransferase
MIHLEEITPDNWRLGLNVSKLQQSYVANDMKLLARAYAYRNQRSNAFIVYNDDTPVGMVLYYDCEELKAYDFSQLFIDESYQGHGYGLETVKQVIRKLKDDGKYNKIILCFIEGNKAAYSLYKKCGFELTGEQDEDEIVMELKI